MSARSTTRRHVLTGASLVAASALVGRAASAAQSQLAPAAPRTGGMPLARYMQYVEWFNANDTRFLQFYHPEVTLELGNATLKGSAAIRDFYADVKNTVVSPNGWTA